MKLLENKIALITGGTRGIGREIVRLFAEQGAVVVFTGSRQSEHSQQLLDDLHSQGAEAMFIASDVADTAAATEVASKVQQAYGRLDVLVNNAGITRDGLLLRMSENDWDSVLDTNLKSVFNYAKAFAPMMIKQRSGSIVNITSIVAINGNAGQCNYAAAKAGILGFTRSLAKELAARNVRCNALAPGFISTPMTEQMSQEAQQNWLSQIPMRRAGTGLDVAKVALFLASDLAAYVTGDVICCDGGLVL